MVHDPSRTPKLASYLQRRTAHTTDLRTELRAADRLGNGKYRARYQVVEGRFESRGLNRSSNRPLKAVFKGASQSARSMLPPNPFRDHYDRKLAAIVLAMWKTESEYKPMS